MCMHLCWVFGVYVYIHICLICYNVILISFDFYLISIVINVFFRLS